MKLIFAFFILTLLLSCHKNRVEVSGVGDVNTSASTSSKFRARRDSIIEVTEFGSVYLSRDTSSRLYGALAPDLRYLDQSYLKADLDTMTDKFGVKIEHFKVHDLKSRWSSLFWLNNAYCLYAPSDWMFNTPVVLTDSVCFDARSDTSEELILDYKLISKIKHQFKLMSVDGRIRFLTIEIIDPNRGIAVWIYSDPVGKPFIKMLMVESEKVKHFPILVYDCGGDKCFFESEGTHFRIPDFLK